MPGEALLKGLNGFQRLSPRDLTPRHIENRFWTVGLHLSQMGPGGQRLVPPAQAHCHLPECAQELAIFRKARQCPIQHAVRVKLELCIGGRVLCLFADC